MKNFLRDSQTDKNYYPPQFPREYLSLTHDDTDSIINIVSRLMSTNCIDGLAGLLGDFNSLILSEGIAIGVFDPLCKANTFTEGTAPKELFPEVVISQDTPDYESKNCKLGNFDFYYKTESCGKTSFFIIRKNPLVGVLRQRQIIHFIRPYLLSCIYRLYRINDCLNDFDLTEREREVIKWIVEGKDNWSISKILGVAERTIKFHNRNIYKKLGVNTKVEVICMYHRFITSINEQS